jgi:hypothetical protein
VSPINEFSDGINVLNQLEFPVRSFNAASLTAHRFDFFDVKRLFCVEEEEKEDDLS